MYSPEENNSDACLYRYLESAGGVSWTMGF
jgi:hypothetical protein